MCVCVSISGVVVCFFGLVWFGLFVVVAVVVFLSVCQSVCVRVLVDFDLCVRSKQTN